MPNEESTNQKPTWPVRLAKHFDRPFAVTVLGGLIVFLISTAIQNRYWETQQQFLIQQATVDTRIKFAKSTEHELVVRIGKFLTAAGLIVGAHEDQFERKQLFETIDHSNKLLREWSEHEEALKLIVRTEFRNEHIQTRFRRLLENLDSLPAAVDELQEFATDGPSTAHQDAIRKCRALIEEIENDLVSLTTLMST